MRNLYAGVVVECSAVLWEETEETFRCELGEGCPARSLRDDPQSYRDAHPNRRQPPHWLRGAEGEAEEHGGEG